MHRKNKNDLPYKKWKHSKTYRKKHKRYKKEMLTRNNRLAKKYPWLRQPDPKAWSFSDTPIFKKDNLYISLWDEVPQGWITAFGYLMCDEIEQALEKDNLQDKVYVEQAKEKYGGLRLYMSGNDESQHIISIYESISEHICCGCGRPHVPMLNIGWVSPYCKKCYNKYINCTKLYEEVASENKEHWKIPNELKWTRFGNNEKQIITEDISERVKKIEYIWNQRHPNDTV